MSSNSCKYYAAIIQASEGRYSFFIGSYFESASLFRKILNLKNKIIAEKEGLSEETAVKISKHLEKDSLIEKLKNSAHLLEKTDVQKELESICF